MCIYQNALETTFIMEANTMTPLIRVHEASRHPDKSVTENYFSYFSTKTYAVGTQKKRLDEMVLLSTQTHG